MPIFLPCPMPPLPPHSIHIPQRTRQLSLSADGHCYKIDLHLKSPSSRLDPIPQDSECVHVPTIVVISGLPASISHPFLPLKLISHERSFYTTSISVRKSSKPSSCTLCQCTRVVGPCDSEHGTSRPTLTGPLAVQKRGGCWFRSAVRMWGVCKQPLMQGIPHVQESQVGGANPSPKEVIICDLPESGYEPPERDTMTTPGARSSRRKVSRGKRGQASHEVRRKQGDASG